VQSHLIAAELHKDAHKIKEAYADKGWVFFTTWDDLIERAKQSHHQFREILQRQATELEESSGAEGDGTSANIETASKPSRKPRKKKGHKK
jgi:hypothetical protein